MRWSKCHAWCFRINIHIHKHKHINQSKGQKLNYRHHKLTFTYITNNRAGKGFFFHLFLVASVASHEAPSECFWSRGAQNECCWRRKKKNKKRHWPKLCLRDLFQMHVVQQGPKDIEADTYGTGGRDLGKLAPLVCRSFMINLSSLHC